MTEQTSIDHVLAAYTAAVLDQDAEALLSLYDDDVRVFDLWSEWTYEGKEAWRRAIGEWFGSLGEQKVGVGFDDVRSSVADDVASVHAIITYRELDAAGNEVGSMQNRLTWVLQRRGDRWLIVHEHTSAPIDGETSKVILRR
jgi:uncharacterized protein (TIGR02246 family)